MSIPTYLLAGLPDNVVKALIWLDRRQSEIEARVQVQTTNTNASSSPQAEVNGQEQENRLLANVIELRNRPGANDLRQG
jgi:hypothetical protein